MLPPVLPRRALFAIALVGWIGAARADPPLELRGSHGDVKVRRLDQAWEPLAPGQTVERGARLDAAERAGAELVAPGGVTLRLRERTTIAIGASPGRGKRPPAAAELAIEEGAVESRLEAAGRVVIRTLDAEVVVGRGRALVAIDGAGDTVVANHDGADVEIYGGGPPRARRPIAVPAGSGLRVRAGLPIEAPRRLPPAPVWVTTPRAYVAFAGRGGRVVVEWAPVPAAARYWVAIADEAGVEREALEVFAPTTRVDLGELPVGRYRVVVSTIDPDGFESAPVEPLAVEVAAVKVIPPGSRAIHDGPPRGADPILTAGSRLVTPDGWSCADAGGPSRSALILAQPGAGRAITCLAIDGTGIDPFVVDVTPIVIHADGRTIRVDAGTHAQVGLQVSSAGPIGDELQVVGGDGITVLSTTQSGGRLEVEAAIALDAPAASSLAIAVGGQPVATVEVTVDPPPPPPPATKSDVAWTATAQAGLVLSRGNADVTTASAAARVERVDPRHKFAATFGLTYARATVRTAADADGNGTIGPGEIAEVSSTSADTWSATARYDRLITAADALYVAALAGADHPAGKPFVAGGQLGYSHRILADDDRELVGEVGYDLSYEDQGAAGIAIHAVRVAGGYRGQLNPHTRLEVSLEVLANLNRLDVAPEPADAGEDARLHGLAALTTALTADVELIVGVELKLDAVPAPRPALALPYDAGFTPVAARADLVTRAALSIALF